MESSLDPHRGSPTLDGSSAAVDGRFPAEVSGVVMLRSLGLKATPQRLTILDLLENNTSHPTAEDLFLAAQVTMPTISLRTVYQTLNELEAHGVIRAIDVGSGSTRFDPLTEPHSHLVCSSCSSVRDVAAVKLREDLPNYEGFIVDSTEVFLRGTCQSCAATT